MARRTTVPLVRGLLVALVVAGLLGAGPGLAASGSVAGAAGLAPTAPGPAAALRAEPDYGSGQFADRLCAGGVLDRLVCHVGRTLQATAQGARQRADATAAGATCEVQRGLRVCFGVTSVLAQRGGTTYGDTFLTSAARSELGADLVAHEREHVRQWRLFGQDFALLYLLQGADACTNYFEVQAGLEAGGYRCG